MPNRGNSPTRATPHLSALAMAHTNHITFHVKMQSYHGTLHVMNAMRLLMPITRFLIDYLTHANAKCENLSLVFHPMFFSSNKIFLFLKLKTHWKILQCSFNFIKSRVFMHLWATDFRVYTAGRRLPFQHFHGLSPPVIMSNR